MRCFLKAASAAVFVLCSPPLAQAVVIDGVDTYAEGQAALRYQVGGEIQMSADPSDRLILSCAKAQPELGQCSHVVIHQMKGNEVAFEESLGIAYKIVAYGPFEKAKLEQLMASARTVDAPTVRILTTAILEDPPGPIEGILITGNPIGVVLVLTPLFSVLTFPLDGYIDLVRFIKGDFDSEKFEQLMASNRNLLLKATSALETQGSLLVLEKKEYERLLGLLERISL